MNHDDERDYEEEAEQSRQMEAEHRREAGLCECCGQLLPPSCDRCGRAYGIPGEPYRLPPPFGSLNAALPVQVCRSCYTDYARLGWTWLGRPDPGTDPFGWERDDA